MLRSNKKKFKTNKNGDLILDCVEESRIFHFGASVSTGANEELTSYEKRPIRYEEENHWMEANWAMHRGLESNSKPRPREEREIMMKIDYIVDGSLDLQRTKDG